MKLLVRKLWFRYDMDQAMCDLFRIPQLQERFDEGYLYEGEMRPRGIKICSGHWPADEILKRLPDPQGNVSLVITSMDLKGKFRRIYGMGQKRRAISTSDGHTDGYGISHYVGRVGLTHTTFGEIGHALGIEHHDFDPNNPCEMSNNQIPHADWKTFEEIRFCDNCYETFRS